MTSPAVVQKLGVALQALGEALEALDDVRRCVKESLRTGVPDMDPAERAGVLGLLDSARKRALESIAHVRGAVVS